MTKRLIVLMLCSCMAATMSFSQETGGTCGVDGDNLTWKFDSEASTLTISGTGAMADYDHLSELGYFRAPWFSIKDMIVLVKIEDGVTNIGGWAFSDCGSLSVIDIPNSVTSIDDNAFRYCSSLASINIPNSVKKIGYQCFLGCTRLTTVNIPNGVTTIMGWAFYLCSGLISIIIPDSVMFIGNNVFYGCTNLSAINVTMGNPNYVSQNGVLFDRAKASLMQYPAKKQASLYNIPNGIKNIENAAFYMCTNLTSVTIPDGVVTIEASVFNSCYKLTSIVTPNSLESIGEAAFGNCYSLTTLVIGNKVAGIESSAFQSCSNLEHIYVRNPIPPVINASVFQYVNKSTCTLHIPVGSTLRYEVTEWSRFYNIEEGLSISTESAELEVVLSVYPNPVLESFSINGIDEETPITLLDMNGAIVLQSIVLPDEPLSVSHLQKGTYILRVGSQVLKVIKL